jgi:hypothetical protein
LIAAFAALICLVFTNTLSDVGRHYVTVMTIAPAPPVPDNAGVRDAILLAHVVDANGKGMAGASVRVFVMRDEKAYFAGEKATDELGLARITGLPRGEVWVLAYAANASRSSTRALLEAGERTVELSLEPAKALDVVVVGDDEKPIEKAEVEVRAADPLPYAGLTDAAGATRIDRLGVGPYTVRATAPGYDPVTRTGVVIASSPLRIRLEHLGAIDASVVEEDGSPAIEATVLIAGSGLWPPRKTTTDVNGTAHIGGLKRGAYDLKARKQDEVSRTEIALLVDRGASKSVKLTLHAGRRVTVKVTDGEGEDAPVIPGAAVVLAEEGLSAFPLVGKTGEKGTVELGPIDRVMATVSARATGFVPHAPIAVGEGAREITVPLTHGGVIEGDVVDDRGYPIAGATLEVIGLDRDGMPVDESSAAAEFRDTELSMVLPGPAPLIPMGELGVMPGPIPDIPPADGTVTPSPVGARGGDPWVTRADGTFHLEPVSPGRLHLIVRHPGYVEVMSDVIELKPGGLAKVHIVMREGGLLEGRVLEEEGRRPVAGARIEIAATNGALERVTYAADDGTFTFAAAPEEVLLSVARPETPSEIAARMVVDVPDRDRRRIEILLPKVRESVKFEVRDDRGYPLDAVEVHAISLDPKVPLSRTLFTNPDGAAELPDALGVPLHIVAVRPSKSPVVMDVESAPKELKIVMPEGMRVVGSIVSGRDHIAGADVTLFTSSGARHAKTNDDGDLEVRDVSAGRARIVVRAKELAPYEAVVHLKGDHDHPADLGRIELVSAGEVEGQVVDDHGDPVAGARVGREGVPTYLPIGPLPYGIVATDRHGEFLLKNVPEGNVTLEAYVSDLGRGIAENVAVRAGRTTRRVKISIAGDKHKTKEPKGAGSVAVTLGEKSGHVVVVMVPPFSEAEVAGVEPGDELDAVNGAAINHLEDARKLLTGPLSEDVVLSLARTDEGTRSEWRARVRRERVRR